MNTSLTDKITDKKKINRNKHKSKRQTMFELKVVVYNRSMVYFI